VNSSVIELIRTLATTSRPGSKDARRYSIQTDENQTIEVTEDRALW
jgi:hypothetical protein